MIYTPSNQSIGSTHLQNLFTQTTLFSSESGAQSKDIGETYSTKTQTLLMGSVIFNLENWISTQPKENITSPLQLYKTSLVEINLNIGILDHMEDMQVAQ